MKRVFLIGYMGSGKTTLGKAYSAATGLQFVDLDWYIEGCGRDHYYGAGDQPPYLAAL